MERMLMNGANAGECSTCGRAAGTTLVLLGLSLILGGCRQEKSVEPPADQQTARANDSTGSTAVERGSQVAGVASLEQLAQSAAGISAVGPEAADTPLVLPGSGGRLQSQSSLRDPSAASGNLALEGETSLAGSSFMMLQPSDSNNPGELVEHLRKIDSAIGDLVRAGTSNLLEKEPYEENGIRLATIKLATGQRLANAQAASVDQRKAGRLSQLEALSHLSSLGDVNAAKQLADLAETLAGDADPDLSRPARIVLIGFELQSLENGLTADPSTLVTRVQGLCTSPEDLNFPSFMMLRQAHSVLLQLGFQQAAANVKETLTSHFLEAPDPQLRGEAWLIAAQSAPALDAYNQAIRGYGTEQFDSSTLLAAMRILYDALPYPATLEQLASTIANFEYGGDVVFSQQVADYVEQEINKLPEESLSDLTRQLLAQHRARLGLVGKPLELGELVDFAGQPFDPALYQGKTILVDFWATWCLPCLKEIPNIRAAYQKYSAQGFTVIGVNMDDNLAPAQEFIQQQNYPWNNFHFAGKLGFEADFAQRAGLTMIPFIVLVGPDGNVVRIHARGTNLDTILGSLLTSADDLNRDPNNK